jgi:hypothetical protein
MALCNLDRLEGQCSREDGAKPKGLHRPYTKGGPGQTDRGAPGSAVGSARDPGETDDRAIPALVVRAGGATDGTPEDTEVL